MIYVYIYKYMYTCVYVCIPEYIYIHMYIYIHLCTAGGQSLVSWTRPITAIPIRPSFISIVWDHHTYERQIHVGGALASLVSLLPRVTLIDDLKCWISWRLEAPPLTSRLARVYLQMWAGGPDFLLARSWRVLERNSDRSFSRFWLKYV